MQGSGLSQPERIKAGREHSVPLSDQAAKLLKALPRDGDFVFVGTRTGTALSDMAMATVLKRMGREGITVHGFRSTFRTWCGEWTNYPRELAEAALSHTIKSKVEAAYLRTRMVEKRRVMMAEWARFAYDPVPPSNVVSIRQA